MTKRQASVYSTCCGRSSPCRKIESAHCAVYLAHVKKSSALKRLSALLRSQNFAVLARRQLSAQRPLLARGGT